MKKILLLTSILVLSFTTILFAQQPTNLGTTNITTNSADLSCDATSICAAAIHYRYKLSSAGVAAWASNTYTNINSDTYSISGLLPNTSYDWSVKCAGVSGWATTETFSTLSIPTGPIINVVTITDSIDCFGGLGEIFVQIVQTNPATAPLELIVGYVANFGVNYVIKQASASLNGTVVTAVVPGLESKEYVIRLVDPVLYYAANTNGSGSSLDGVYDEYLINLVEPNQLISSTLSISTNTCNAICIAEENLFISGGTMPYSFSVNSNPSINLSNGDSIYEFVNLCADIYNVVVTDTNGCSTFTSPTIFTITEPSEIDTTLGTMSILNPNFDNVSCFGESDGEITAATSGGTGSFTYAIGNGAFQSGTLFSGLSAGSYIITYKDFNNCTATQNFTLTEPPALSGSAIELLAVDCYGANTGEIAFQIDPSNPGDPVYQFSIDNFTSSSQSDSVFNNLFGDSTYTVKIMDANGCIDSSFVYLAEPAQIIYSTILSDYNNYEVSCNNSSDGSISFTLPSGGLAPYTYSIDAGASFNPPNFYPNLSEGVYNIAVKDADGCIEPGVDTLNEPGIFSLPLVVNTIDCYGNCNGEIIISPLNGVGQILYAIDGGPYVATASFAGLCGDLTNTSPYIFDAVDDNGCVADTAILIDEPTSLEYVTDSILEYCDQLDGEASISVTGGTGILSYIWNSNPLQNSSVLDSVAAGTYIVEVADANNCPLSVSVTVLAEVGFTISFTAISPCLGDSSGSATVLSSQTGQAPYTYQWSNVNGTIMADTFSTIVGMPIGSYSVVVTDASGCVRTGDVDIISSSNPIVIDSIVVINNSCDSIDDAQIEIFASGGTGPYNYSYTYGITTTTDPTPVFGQLAANTYTIRAFDFNGCFDDTVVILSYPELLEIDSTVFTNINCFGADDGAVQEIQFVGGTGPFEFAIDGGVHQTFMIFSDLDAGLHTVEVFDANNCVSSDYIIITEPTLFEVDITVSDWNNYQIRCNGDNSGYVDILGSGGTAPYLVNSTTFLDTINIDGISAGSSTFVVEDANGCPYQEIILFEEPDQIQHNFFKIDVLCEAWNNGSLTDSVFGGVGSATTYSYLWDTGDTTYSLDSLSAGIYEITVTDENGCISTDSETIIDDNILSVIGVTIQDVSCNGGNDGQLSVTASGGVAFLGLAPYTYLWNDDIAQNTDTAVALSVNSSPLNSDTIYNCIVTDASGCVVTLDLPVFQPSELEVKIIDSISVPISCYGESDGELTVSAEGGTPGYTFLWSNGQTTQDISGLSTGIYKATVEDSNGCRDTVEVYLNDPTPLEIDTIFEVDISCFGYNNGEIKIFASGGSSFEYTYLYTLYLNEQFYDSVTNVAGSDTLQHTPLVFNSLAPGNYYIEVEDRAECVVTSLSVEITEPFEPLTISVDSIDETCLLNAPGENGVIRIFPQGGSQMYKYVIDSDPTSPIFSANAYISDANIEPGWHYIEVMDSRGCEVFDTTYIKSYDPIFLPDTVSRLVYNICLGQSININIEERPNLTYTWNDGIISGDRMIKPEGFLPYGIMYDSIYVVTVTDFQDCEIQDTVFVNFEAIDPMIDSDPGVLYGDYPVVLEGGNIDLFSNNTGNDIEYTWKWDDNIVIDTVGNSITISELLSDVWYYLDIKDADGCLGYDSIYVVVGIKAIGESTVYEAITPNNDGFNDTWSPLNIESYEDALVQVFNRWGGLVFESKGGINYQAWDGTNNGEELAIGTYYYIIDLNTGDEFLTGPVTIIR